MLLRTLKCTPSNKSGHCEIYQLIMVWTTVHCKSFVLSQLGYWIGRDREEFEFRGVITGVTGAT